MQSHPDKLASLEEPDFKLLEPVLAKLKKVSKLIGWIFGAFGVFMMGIMGYVEAPWWVAAFFGGFLFFMLIMMNSVLSAYRKKVIADIEMGQKLVFKGAILDKWQLDKSSRRKIGYETIEASVDSGKKSYFRIGGYVLGIPSDFYARFQIGDIVEVHMLPESKAVFDVRGGFTDMNAWIKQ